MQDRIKTLFALKKLPIKWDRFLWNSPVFLFANENIAEYLEDFSETDMTRTLAVAGSGDHAFEAVLKGAKNVDLFDVNYLQKHVVELKKDMIKYLPYENFMEFFFEPNSFFNPKIIQPIEKQFSGGLKVFLKHFYDYRNKHMFRYMGPTHERYRTNQISYIEQKSEYERLKEIMPQDFKFINCDLVNLSAKLTDRYDFMMLSNILGYMYPEIRGVGDKFVAFYEQVLYPLTTKHLKDGGHVCFHYNWNASFSEWSEFLYYFQQALMQPQERNGQYIHKMFAEPVHTAMKDTGWWEDDKLDVALMMAQIKRQR